MITAEVLVALRAALVYPCSTSGFSGCEAPRMTRGVGLGVPGGFTYHRHLVRGDAVSTRKR